MQTEAGKLFISLNGKTNRKKKQQQQQK